jgi:Arc/MetJ-type ribon-helix-helix transcriptional regulator
LPAPEPPRACLQAHAAGQARTRDDGNHAAYRWSAEPGKGTGQGAERLPAGRAFRSYDPGVSDRKIRVTVRLEPRLVEAGKAPSVSAVVNDALEARRQRDLKARRLWQEAAERADPDKVARMIAHVEAQAAQLPASHRYR